MNVRSAFQKAGIVPFGPARILSTCPLFRQLSQEQADLLFRRIPSMFAIVKERGKLTETEFSEMFEGIVEDRPNSENSTRMVIDDMVTNRQRALIFSNPEYAAEMAARSEAKVQRHEVSRSRSLESDTLGLSSTPKLHGYMRCVNSTCLKEGERKNFAKCIGKACRSWFCSTSICAAMKQQHEIVCGKVGTRKNMKQDRSI